MTDDDPTIYLILTPKMAGSLHSLLSTQIQVGEAMTSILPESMHDTIAGIEQPIRDVQDALEAAMQRADVDPD